MKITRKRWPTEQEHFKLASSSFGSLFYLFALGSDPRLLTT